MKTYTNDLQHQIERQLVDAAFAYLDVGLRHFYEHLEYKFPGPGQVALGNIAIAIELMLKAFVAHKSLLLLFKGLPLETRALLLCPDTLPDSFRWRTFDIELRSSTDKIIDFGECVATLFLFMPELKQRMKSHMEALLVARNAGVHSVLPAFQRFEPDRAAYVALTILNKFQENNALLDINLYSRADARDQEFLLHFTEMRLEGVQAQLKAAKERAKRLNDQYIPPQTGWTYPWNDWSALINECPVCGHKAILRGFTDIDKVVSEETQEVVELLHFFPESFICDKCGLALADFDELYLAGISAFIGRAETVEEYKRSIEQNDTGSSTSEKSSPESRHGG